MKKMNMYVAPKAEVIEMQTVVVLNQSADGEGPTYSQFSEDENF